MKHLNFILFAIWSFLYSQKAQSQPGQLDTSFGEKGKVIQSISAEINSSEIQKDGKILLGGNIGNKSPFSVARYMTDGTIDNSFGNSGVASVSFSGFTSPALTDIALLQDNSIIAVGNGLNKENNKETILIAKIKAEGILDSTFGSNGYSAIDLGEDNYYAFACSVLKDGKIIIGGSTHSYQHEDIPLVLRCLSDGLLDKSFGDGGKAFQPKIFNASFNSLGIQSNGKIVAATNYTFDYPTATAIISLFNADGSVDESFGNKGIAEFKPSGKSATISSIIIQQDNKIVAAGGIFSGGVNDPSQMMTVRFNTDGTLDKNFGNSAGYTEVVSDSNTYANDLILQTNGKIVIGGITYKSFAADYSFILSRFLSNGIIDSAFGESGVEITDLGFKDNLTTLSLQSDGKILSAGYIDGDANGILMARYYGDPVKQPSPIAKRIRRWIRNHTLQWQPLNDEDIAYYSIQQSSNGVNGFKEIGRIQSQNSKVKSKNEEAVYSYSLNNTSSSNIQNSTPNTNYYRITAVSNSGSNVTSEVIADESVSSITISPNPVKDVMKIAGLPEGQKATINIINRNGNVLQSATCNSSICNMNVSQLKSGLYNVQVNVNGKLQSMKFVKE